MRKLLSATVSAALCCGSVTPALAQDYRFSNDAPRGATATLNLRVPLGAQRDRARPSYGLTFGYGQEAGSPTMDGRTVSRSVRLGDIRFAGGELRHARLASFDLAHLDRDRRLNLGGGSGTTVLIVVGAVAGAVAACLVLDCFDGGDDDDLN